jgi:hypothetical protein
MSDEPPKSRRYSVKSEELDRFPNMRPYMRREGSSVSLAEDETRFYVIVNESAMWDFLDEDDKAFAGISVTEFDTDAGRTEYLTERGWYPVPEAAAPRRLPRFPRLPDSE